MENKSTGFERVQVEICLDRPGHYHLARLELRLPERDPRDWWDLPASFLLELPGGCDLIRLIRLDEPFDYGPRAFVASRKEWATRMSDQDFEVCPDSVRQKTRGSHDPRHYAGCVTALATYPTTDPGLASFDTRLQLGRSEPLAVGVKRVTMEQLEFAASGYFDGEAEFGLAVHESRKAIKRTRSLLRLVKGELPERIYEYEDRSLRQTGRMVSDVRSAAAVVNAASIIRDLYGDLLAEDTFVEMIQRLSQRRDIVELRALEDPNLVGRVVRNLERAYNRYASWPTDEDAREVYGMGIRDGFAAIEPGLRVTYKTGRVEMVRAYEEPTPHRFHQWRKRAKYLRHQMEFLAPLWPEVVVGTAMTLDRLGMILGEDHDLAELLDLLKQRPDICHNPRERSLFAALAAQRRSELQTAAEILGRRVYAEKPGSMSHRFGEYWESRGMANSNHLDTIVVY